MYSFGCPWGVSPKSIDSDNVADKSAVLADQYRKKAQLYRTNSLLIPLGDDFRYDNANEWKVQYDNYKLLIDYINQKEDLNMKVFSLLLDFFLSYKIYLGTIWDIK